MGCCGSGVPQCSLGRTELDAIQALARDAVNKSPLPTALLYVGRHLTSKGMEYRAVVMKLKVDTNPVRQYDPVGGDQRVDILESTSKLMAVATQQTAQVAIQTLTTAAVACTKGGSSPQDRERCAQATLQSAAQQAVFMEVERVLTQSGDALTRGITVQTGAAAPLNPNSMPPPLNPAALDQQQQPRSFNYQQPQQQQQQPWIASGPPGSPQGQAPYGGGDVAESEWERYPVPVDNGPWVKVSDAFHWSESAQLYFFPAAGHFFHPESGMWHDPETDRWMDEDQHEALLERMAEQGLY
jgi:hypothetical protein